MDRSSQHLAQRGSSWLRLFLHRTCCHDSSSCGVPQCIFARHVIKHIHSTPPSVCGAGTCETGAVCTSLRQLQAHYVVCQDPLCSLCLGVSQDPIPTQPIVVSSTDDSSATFCHSSHDVRDTDSNRGSEKADSEANSVFQECDHSPGLHGSSMLSVNDAVSSISDGEELAVFAGLLLHSLLRWQGASAQPTTCLSLLDAAQESGLQQGRDLWTHILTECSRVSDACTHPGCRQARHVLLHMLDCQIEECTLCGPTKRAFASGSRSALPHSTANRATDMPNWMQGLEESLVRLSL